MKFMKQMKRTSTKLSNLVMQVGEAFSESNMFEDITIIEHRGRYSLEGVAKSNTVVRDFVEAKAKRAFINKQGLGGFLLYSVEYRFDAEKKLYEVWVIRPVIGRLPDKKAASGSFKPVGNKQTKKAWQVLLKGLQGDIQDFLTSVRGMKLADFEGLSEQEQEAVRTMLVDETTKRPSIWDILKDAKDALPPEPEKDTKSPTDKAKERLAKRKVKNVVAKQDTEGPEVTEPEVTEPEVTEPEATVPEVEPDTVEYIIPEQDIEIEHISDDDETDDLTVDGEVEEYITEEDLERLAEEIQKRAGRITGLDDKPKKKSRKK